MNSKKSAKLKLLSWSIGFCLALTLIGGVIWRSWPQPLLLSFAGSHYDIGGTVFPAYSYPQTCIVPWRSNSVDNVMDSDGDGDDYYGTAGYILFATRFDFPDANPPNSGNSSLPVKKATEGSAESLSYPIIADLPGFVVSWEIIAERMAGGWSYALIDDPRHQHGIRLWTFDGKHYPPPTNENTTGVVPFLKIGVIDGPDFLPDNPEFDLPRKRWSFTVGESVPPNFRVGVITDGLDSPNAAPRKILLQRVGDDKTVESPELQRNRFVDIHCFDIVNARPGDTFIFSTIAPQGGIGAAISGFSFDINTIL